MKKELGCGCLVLAGLAVAVLIAAIYRLADYVRDYVEP